LQIGELPKGAPHLLVLEPRLDLLGHFVVVAVDVGLTDPFGAVA
jgi:hypothetical protein